jgi:lipopolysaccharide export system permease protein
MILPRIPILWRYLLFNFTKIFLTTIVSFIAILFVSRCKEIARFAALSESIQTTLLFMAYQIPLILPVALPISALLASVLLVQKINRSFELIALRASGISLFTTLTPLLLFSVLLSCLNFSLSAKAAPFCRRSTKEFLYYETSSNPLLLLQRQNLIKTKQSFVKMDPSTSDDKLHHFFLITARGNLSLISAETLWTENEALRGSHIALISHFANENDQTFDPLLVENQKDMTTDASTFCYSLKRKRPKLDVSGLEFSLLKVCALEKGKLSKKAKVEMARRISLSLALFSFTLLGAAFSVQVGRTASKKRLATALSLALLLMISYLFGKECKTNLSLALSILFAPHLLIWIASFRQLFRINRGYA